MANWQALAQLLTRQGIPPMKGQLRLFEIPSINEIPRKESDDEKRTRSLREVQPHEAAGREGVPVPEGEAGGEQTLALFPVSESDGAP